MAGFLRSLFGGGSEPEVGTVPEPVGVSSEAEPIPVTDDTFEEKVLASALPVMVDFWAPWCGPCRMVAPIVEDLARAYDGRAVMAKVNTDESSGVAAKLGIRGIPTLIIFKDGREVDRIVGFAPRRELEEKLDLALA